MHKLAQLCIRRPVFATMLILSLVVVGVFSYFSLGVDLFPKVDIPSVAVIVADPGASPEEIETEITKKVEDAVNTISMIDEVRSTSSEGQSLVIVTFELSKNGDVAAQESSEQGQSDRPRSAANAPNSRWCRSSIRTPRPSCRLPCLRRARCAT